MPRPRVWLRWRTFASAGLISWFPEKHISGGKQESRLVYFSLSGMLFYPSTSHNFRSLIYKYFLHLVRHKKWMLSHIHLGLPLKCLLYSLLLSDGFLLCSSPSGIQQDVCTFILVLARCLHFKQFYEEEWVLFILLLLFMAQWLTYG